MEETTRDGDTKSEGCAAAGQTVAVIGAGPGLGASVARTFAANGCRVGLFARSADRLGSLEAEILDAGGRAMAIPTDITEPAAVREGFDALRDNFGSLDGIVSTVYASDVDGGLPKQTDPSDLEDPYRVEVEGVYRCLKEVLPDLRVGGREEVGSIILTNSADARRGDPESVARSVARGGLANLADSLARAEAEHGVHVVHAVIDGWIGTPPLREAFPERPAESWIDPDDLAEEYWNLFEQPPSAWTYEPDFRCQSDSFDAI